MKDSDCLAGLTQISRFAGERFDLVQAGGGNSSVKLCDGTLLIKASGAALSEVGPGAGYARVDNAKVFAILRSAELRAAGNRDKREAVAARLLASAVRGSPRPSIEIFLHAMLKRFTLHTHPAAVVAGAGEPALERFCGDRAGKALAVPYATPGVELALKLGEELARFHSETGIEPGIIILENHGLITTSDSADGVIRLTETTVLAFEKLLGADLSRFRKVSALSSMLKAAGCAPAAVYRSSDSDLLAALKKKRKLFFLPPAAPDTVVFCGMNTVEIPSAPGGAAALARYAARHGEPPKVIVWGGQLFFTGRNIKKARDAEEVYKAHILALLLSKGKARPLSCGELRCLSRWEAEKFRRDA